ncbi:MAG: extracellular solute-binding protein, partial [Beggiatoa sp.]|nr:extracellular solute-binding protein [Beggiatoa sp.]
MRHLAALSLLCALAACGGAAPGPTVIDFWAMGREGEAVKALLPEFERRHPGLRVRVQQVPWSAAHEKLLTAFAGDALPDVFHLGNTWLPELVALRALAPLDAWLPGSIEITGQVFFAGLFETQVFDGHAYGLPWYVDARLLFYRQDRLAEAGFSAPPRTWAEWITAMERIQAQAGASTDRRNGHAIFLPMNEWEPPVILALGLGASLLKDQDRYGNFRDTRFRRAFEFYTGIFDRDLAPALGQNQIANLYQDLARDRFAMFITGPWNIGELRRRLPAKTFALWRTAPMPEPETLAPGSPRPGVSIAGGASLVVSRRSPHPEAAFRLVEYLCDGAQQLRFYRATGNLPARRDTWIAGDLETDPLVAGFWEQMQHLRSTPAIPEWERIASGIER